MLPQMTSSIKLCRFPSGPPQHNGPPSPQGGGCRLWGWGCIVALRLPWTAVPPDKTKSRFYPWWEKEAEWRYRFKHSDLSLFFLYAGFNCKNQHVQSRVARPAKSTCSWLWPYIPFSWLAGMNQSSFSSSASYSVYKHHCITSKLIAK